jgi:uncharacterized membrane protein
MDEKNVTELHQTVVETNEKVTDIIRNHETAGSEVPNFHDRFADRLFEFGSSGRFIFLFVAIIVAWVIYNLAVPLIHSIDRPPFQLMCFILAAVAAIQAPIIMMSQHRQSDKTTKRIATDLKIDHEVLALHRSIVVLTEQQLQHVLENQILMIKLLEDLQQERQVHS